MYYATIKSFEVIYAFVFYLLICCCSLPFPPPHPSILKIDSNIAMNDWDEYLACKFCNVFRLSVHLSVVENHVAPYPTMPGPSLHLVLKAVTALLVLAVEAQVTMNILHYTSNNLEIGCTQKCSSYAQHLLAKSLACSLNWPQHSFSCFLHQKMPWDRRLKKQWSLYWVMDKSLHQRHC